MVLVNILLPIGLQGLHLIRKYSGSSSIAELKQVGWNHQIVGRWLCDYQFKVNTEIAVSVCQVMSNSFRTQKNLLGTQLR